MRLPFPVAQAASGSTRAAIIRIRIELLMNSSSIVGLSPKRALALYCACCCPAHWPFDLGISSQSPQCHRSCWVLRSGRHDDRLIVSRRRGRLTQVVPLALLAFRPKRSCCSCAVTEDSGTGAQAVRRVGGVVFAGSCSSMPGDERELLPDEVLDPFFARQREPGGASLRAHFDRELEKRAASALQRPPFREERQAHALQLDSKRQAALAFARLGDGVPQGLRELAVRLALVGG